VAFFEHFDSRRNLARKCLNKPLYPSTANVSTFIGTVDIDAHTWQMIVAVALSVFILVEIEKFFMRLFPPKAAIGNSKK